MHTVNVFYVIIKHRKTICTVICMYRTSEEEKRAGEIFACRQIKKWLWP